MDPSEKKSTASYADALRGHKVFVPKSKSTRDRNDESTQTTKVVEDSKVDKSKNQSRKGGKSRSRQDAKKEPDKVSFSYAQALKGPAAAPARRKGSGGNETREAKTEPVPAAKRSSTEPVVLPRTGKGQNAGTCSKNPDQPFQKEKGDYSAGHQFQPEPVPSVSKERSARRASPNGDGYGMARCVKTDIHASGVTTAGRERVSLGQYGDSKSQNRRHKHSGAPETMHQARGAWDTNSKRSKQRATSPKHKYTDRCFSAGETPFSHASQASAHRLSRPGAEYHIASSIIQQPHNYRMSDETRAIVHSMIESVLATDGAAKQEFTRQAIDLHDRGDISLWDTQLGCDVHIKCGDVTWKVHHDILCRESDWFKERLPPKDPDGEPIVFNCDSHDPRQLGHALIFMYHHNTGESPLFGPLTSALDGEPLHRSAFCYIAGASVNCMSMMRAATDAIDASTDLLASFFTQTPVLTLRHLNLEPLYNPLGLTLAMLYGQTQAQEFALAMIRLQRDNNSNSENDTHSNSNSKPGNTTNDARGTGVPRISAAAAAAAEQGAALMLPLRLAMAQLMDVTMMYLILNDKFRSAFSTSWMHWLYPNLVQDNLFFNWRDWLPPPSEDEEEEEDGDGNESENNDGQSDSGPDNDEAEETLVEEGPQDQEPDEEQDQEDVQEQEEDPYPEEESLQRIGPYNSDSDNDDDEEDRRDLGPVEPYEDFSNPNALDSDLAAFFEFEPLREVPVNTVVPRAFTPANQRGRVSSEENTPSPLRSPSPPPSVQLRGGGLAAEETNANHNTNGPRATPGDFSRLLLLR